MTNQSKLIKINSLEKTIRKFITINIKELNIDITKQTINIFSKVLKELYEFFDGGDKEFINKDIFLSDYIDIAIFIIENYKETADLLMAYDSIILLIKIMVHLDVTVLERYNLVNIKKYYYDNTIKHFIILNQ